MALAQSHFSSPANDCSLCNCRYFSDFRRYLNAGNDVNSCTTFAALFFIHMADMHSVHGLTDLTSNIHIVVQLKQNAPKTECMFKLSKIQSPSKPAFVSQHLPMCAQHFAHSLTLLFMPQRSSFSLSSTVGRIFFLIIFYILP